jgi:glycosyltransferase involved in cell wall biosynthesis
VRILHAITTLDVGGAEMHLLAQVAGQRARGHAVRVCFLKGEGTLAPDFRAAGAEVVERAGVAALFRHARWAELVHSHLLMADALTALVATAAGRRRRLCSGKHNDEQVLLKPLVSLAHGVLGNLPVRTIVVSDHVGRFVERHGRVARAKQSRIYYGVDPAPFEAAARRLAPGSPARAAARERLGLAPDDVVFLCVARFAPQKAHGDLLRAFARARARRADMRLLLVGDDPFGDGRARAEALATELELAPGGPVSFLGIRRDVPDLLGLSDAFCMASRWEGLGLVFLEAMAAGLPVLATRVSAVPEVVVDGRTGLLSEPGEPADMARGMLDLAADPARRRDLGAAGRARVAVHFGLDRMVDETLAVYDDLRARRSS